MSTVIADETNYQKIKSEKPNYELFLLPPQEGSDDVTLTSAGGQRSSFKIPSNVLNFAKSVLHFDIDADAQGANNYGGLFAGGSIPAIRDVELVTKNGLRVIDIPNLNKYLQVVRKSDTKLADFLTNSDTGLDPTNTTGSVNGNYRFPVAADGNPALTQPRPAHISTEPQYSSVISMHQALMPQLV